MNISKEDGWWRCGCGWKYLIIQELGIFFIITHAEVILAELNADNSYRYLTSEGNLHFEKMSDYQLGSYIIEDKPGIILETIPEP